MKHLVWIASLFLCGSALAETPKLSKAYLKELAFLKAQKRSLLSRKTELEAASASQIARARAEVDRLEGRMLSVQRTVVGLDERLRAAERNQERGDKAGLAIETLSRAREALTVSGFDLAALPADRAPTAEETSAVIAQTFDRTTQLLAAASAVRVDKKQFFLDDGTLVDGEIVHVGFVAAMGVSPKGSGALAPAGGGRFRIWPAPAAPTALALRGGGHPPSLRMFLFEQTDKAITAKAEKTVYDEIRLGGLIGWVIVGLGLLAFVMIVYRTVTIFVLDARTSRLIREVLPLVKAGQMHAAKRIVDGARGAAARVLQVTLRNLGAERARIDDVIEEAMLDETPHIERFGTAITVFAAIAPLLGLLGTVTGMIATFDVITEFGTGDPRMLSGGISEALITTKFGLLVAIPALLFGTLLAGRADALIMRIEHAALKLVNASEGLDADPSVPSEPPQTAPIGVAELAQ